MREEERKQEQLQTENFTATLSHEMRTPLLSIVFFLNTILASLRTVPFDLTTIPQNITYIELVIN